MPVKLSTTVRKIGDIPNTINRALLTSHANNETSASGNISSVPGTSQIVGDRRHAPV